MLCLHVRIIIEIGKARVTATQNHGFLHTNLLFANLQTRQQRGTRMGQLYTLMEVTITQKIFRLCGFEIRGYKAFLAPNTCDVTSAGIYAEGGKYVYKLATILLCMKALTGYQLSLLSDVRVRCVRF